MSSFNDCCSALLLRLFFKEKTNNAAGHAGDINFSNAGPAFRVDNVIAAGHAGDIELSNAGRIFRVDPVSAAGHAGVIQTINASGSEGGLRRLGLEAQLIDWTTRSINTCALDWLDCNPHKQLQTPSTAGWIPHRIWLGLAGLSPS